MSHTATLLHKQALTELIGQSRSVRYDSCMLQLCRAIKLCDKIAAVTSV